MVNTLLLYTVNTGLLTRWESYFDTFTLYLIHI